MIFLGVAKQTVFFFEEEEEESYRFDRVIVKISTCDSGIHE